MSSPQPSQPAPAAAAAAAASSVAGKKQSPQLCHAGPNPVIEEDSKEGEQQGADHVSPIARLYRHALESVFSFLELPDLSRCLAVRRTWAAAVRSMKSIGAKVQQPQLQPSVLCASALATHVSSLLWYTPESPINCDSGDLQLISLCLPKLTALSCQVVLPQPTPLVFSAKLTDVNIGFTCDEAAVPSINAAIVALSRLPLLTELLLDVPHFFPAISFAALQSLNLLVFNAVLSNGANSQMTLEQLDHLRSLVQLRSLYVENITGRNLTYLLRAPHQLQLQEIPWVLEVDEGMSAVLSALPTLTALRASRCGYVGFLALLIHLRALKLSFHGQPHDVLPDVLVSALSHCTRLEELDLMAAPVTAAHLRALLPRLPLLRSLTLACCTELQSLVFFSECANLQRSLTQLTLRDCRHADLHVTEMRHLYTLTSLTSLHIVSSFAEPLDPLSQSLHTPPSLLILSLTEFTYEPPPDVAEED